MNWGTMCQRIILSTGATQNKLDQVKQAIVDALDHHRHEQFIFAAANFTFTLTQSKYAYSFADANLVDPVQIVGEYLYLNRGGSSDERHPILRVSMAELEYCRSDGGAYESQPEVWAVFGKSILLYPTPDSSTDIVTGRAYVDQWVPIVRYESGTWKYYKPGTTTFNSGNELTDAYPTGSDTNPWFTDSGASAMIRHYAEYLLWSQIWQANDGQDQRALLAYTQAQNAMESRSTGLEAHLDIEPYPIGPYG